MRWIRSKNIPEQGAEAAQAPRLTGGRRKIERLVRAHAEQLLKPVFRTPFADDVFLAGGAFKPLINPARSVRDLDLWVRDRRARERLVDYLQLNGAVLVEDFHPYCLRFVHSAGEIEVTYQNVKDNTIDYVLKDFDIAPCAIGANYRDGRIISATVSDTTLRSLNDGRVLLTDEYLKSREEKRGPDLLQSIDRIGRFADETGFDIDTDQVEDLWHLYDNVYSEDERQACVDTYLSTTVEYKGRCNLELLQRANARAAVASVEESGYLIS